MQLSAGSISQAAEKNPADSDSFFRQVLEKAQATAQAPYKPRAQAPLPEQLDNLNCDLSKTGLIAAPAVRGAFTISQGEIRSVITQANRLTGGWRLFFDLASARGTSADLQATLEQNGAPISETWLYRFQQQ